MEIETRKTTQLQWKSASFMSAKFLPSIISGDLQLPDALRWFFVACKCFTSHITEQSHSNKLLSNRSVFSERILSKTPNGIRWILFPYKFLYGWKWELHFLSEHRERRGRDSKCKFKWNIKGTSHNLCTLKRFESFAVEIFEKF